jgi:hypothetical protein
MAIIKLNDKIKFIKRALKTPYHFFYLTPNKQIMIILEDKQGKRYSYTGNTIFNSVETAEEYVKGEISAGSIKEPKTHTKELKKEQNKDEDK